MPTEVLPAKNTTRDYDTLMTDIQVENLTKVFDTPAGDELAVDDVSFEAEDGEFVTIVGPSGCGKTTLLRCIAGLETPTSGKILFDEEDVTNVIPQRRHLGMVFQNIALYSHMTAAENITYPLKVRGVEKAVRRERLEEAADILQISEYIDKRPPELSGGQQQRVALARCLVQQPRAFLFDEPTSNLDAKLKVEIRKEIQKVAQETGDTMIYVTHDQEEAMTMSDKVIVMNDGNIMQIGTPDEVYDQPINTFVGSFMGTPTMNQLDGVKQDGSLVIGDFGEIELRDEPELPDGKYIFGFRPESATISNGKGNIRATVQLTESIGNGSIVYTDTPQGEIRLMTDRARRSIPEGEEITIAVDQDDLVWFDAESRERVHKGA